ncbi:MAG TPA: glycosyltransferase family 4 protein [Gemmatimonadales bacterium]
MSSAAARVPVGGPWAGPGDAFTRLRGLRIAHLIETNGPGGAERTVVHLACELQAAGCHNLVIVPAGGEGWLPNQLAGTGVAVESFRLERPLSPAFARRLTSLLRHHRIALAHSHEFTMALYGAWAAWRAGVPLVTTMHGGRYYARHLRRRLALRAAFALTGRVVAVSNDLAAHLSRDLWIAASRITTVGNGARPAPAPVSHAREDLGLGPQDRLVVTVGNLYPVKGHRHAVEALALLQRPGQRVHLAIAGRGDLAETLRAQAADLGVADRLHLLGLRGDIANVLAGADVFILPSLSEGLPVALLEAMFAGCAIVASDVGDVGTALEGGRAGILVPAGDAPALARAVGGLLDSPARAREFGVQARRRAMQEYDVTRMATRYAAIYRDLLA